MSSTFGRPTVIMSHSETPPSLIRLSYATSVPSGDEMTYAMRAAWASAVVNWVGGTSTAYYCLARFGLGGKIAFLVLCACLTGLAIFGAYEARVARRTTGVRRLLAGMALASNLAAAGLLAIGFAVSMVWILYSVSR